MNPKQDKEVSPDIKSEPVEEEIPLPISVTVFPMKQEDAEKAHSSDEESKKELSVLRSTGMMEKRKTKSVKARAAADMILDPPLYYFEEIRFQHSSVTPRQSTSSLELPVGTSGITRPSGSENSVVASQSASSLSRSPYLSRKGTKKRSRGDLSELACALVSAASTLAGLLKEDPLDTYGKLVVHRLRMLDKEDCLVVQNKIDNILYERLLKKVKKCP